jgi:hypothetical protein
MENSCAKLCPSAQPDMENCRVLGVVQPAENGKSMMVYLNQILPATREVLAMAAPAQPTAIFRLAATCEESKCSHFDGKDCRLATRIVERMPEVVDVLPPCVIRKDCRWYFQEGGAACKRCPQVTTVNYEASEELQEIAGVGPLYEAVSA